MPQHGRDLVKIAPEAMERARAFVRAWFDTPDNYHSIEAGGVGDTDALICGLAYQLDISGQDHRQLEQKSLFLPSVPLRAVYGQFLRPLCSR